MISWMFLSVSRSTADVANTGVLEKKLANMIIYNTNLRRERGFWSTTVSSENFRQGIRREQDNVPCVATHERNRLIVSDQPTWTIRPLLQARLVLQKETRYIVLDATVSGISG